MTAIDQKFRLNSKREFVNLKWTYEPLLHKILILLFYSGPFHGGFHDDIKPVGCVLKLLMWQNWHNISS